MPCDYAQYHPDWKWIRRQILDQAENRCEFCGVANYAVGLRLHDGEFLELRTEYDRLACRTTPQDGRCVRIVLTIAHLDHNIANNDPCNLRALCQRCHLRWDHEHHLRNAGTTRRKRQAHAGQLEMAVS